MTTAYAWIATYFAEAGRIARLPRLSSEFARSWNALEDKVLACNDSQLDAILDYCAHHMRDDHEAFCVLTSMLPLPEPTMEDLLDA